ncbi:MAG: hypothetical protein V4722_20275 [Bacteroidota bacterium]
MHLITTTILLFIAEIAFTQNRRYFETDSSRIEIQTSYLGTQTIKELIKRKNKINYTVKDDKGTIEIVGKYDSLENKTGVWKYYNGKGQLIRSEDFDNRLWSVYKFRLYPHKNLLNEMKAKADALLIAIYGKEFFKNLKWNFENSFYSIDEDNTERWTEPTNKRPGLFLFRYDIQLDSTHLYRKMIEFEIDAKGRFKGNDTEAIFGFQKLSKDTKAAFRLTDSKAIEIAKANGLVETDSSRARTFLKWEGNYTNNFFNGSFKYYVTIKREILKSNLNGSSVVSIKYDVYIIDPWTSEFVEMKKMKSVNYRDSSSGLFPDK